MKNTFFKTRNLLIVIQLVFFSNALFAQSDCACCTDEHKQFDFWVGDWIVHDTTGNIVGENTIVKLVDNCVISEHWRGAQGMTGRSYNYFSQADSTWNQVWIDSQGSNLALKGKAKPGEMVLMSDWIAGTKIDWYANRISWSKNDDGTVTQLWEIVDKNDNVLSEAFKGIYKRRE